MKRIYIVLASILVVASCEKPTGEAPKTPVKDTGGNTPVPKQWHVSTVAGSAKGHKDATGEVAQFDFPSGIAVSSDGTLYVADTENHRIRKIDRLGVVETIAGSTQGDDDGKGTDAQFDSPNGVAVTSDGTLYVADSDNHRIRKIDRLGVVETIAGSTQGYDDTNKGTDAQFDYPYGIAVSSDGTLYVADSDNHRIRKIDTSGVVETVAGSDTDGHKDAIKGTDAQFDSPYGIAVSSDDGTLYVADTENHRIRKIDLSSGVVETIAGSIQGYRDAAGTDAQFDSPGSIAVSPDDGTLYVADSENHRIRKIDLSSGVVTTIAGSIRGIKDAAGTDAQFDYPYGIAVTSDGTLYVADSENHRIRKIEFK